MGLFSRNRPRLGLDCSRDVAGESAAVTLSGGASLQSRSAPPNRYVTLCCKNKIGRQDHLELKTEDAQAVACAPIELRSISGDCLAAGRGLGVLYRRWPFLPKSAQALASSHTVRRSDAGAKERRGGGVRSGSQMLTRALLFEIFRAWLFFVSTVAGPSAVLCTRRNAYMCLHVKHRKRSASSELYVHRRCGGVV